MEYIIKYFHLDEIDKSWNDFFFSFFGKVRLEKLLTKLEIEWKSKKCCPDKKNIFRLFRELPLEKIKVVILGQDPYHQSNIADGIAFSTEKKNFIPASLNNIFIELSDDLQHGKKRRDPNLIDWVKQGVFLINTSLTVIESNPLSHSNIWKDFAYELLKYIDKHDKNLVWVFWGKESKNLRDKCEIKNNFIVNSSHPSPFSASFGFFGSKPFSQINKYLKMLNKLEIKWIEDD